MHKKKHKRTSRKERGLHYLFYHQRYHQITKVPCTLRETRQNNSITDKTVQNLIYVGTDSIEMTDAKTNIIKLNLLKGDPKTNTNATY